MSVPHATNHENIPIRYTCPVGLPFAIRLFSKGV
jgi:hypothetical protein